MEILVANTDNKFSFNRRSKIPVEKLVRYSVTSLEWLHTLIKIKKEPRLLTVGSRKLKNLNLESKGSLEPFASTNSSILWHFLSSNTQINLYQEISKISLTEIFKTTNNKVPTLLNNLSNVREKVHNVRSFQ